MKAIIEPARAIPDIVERLRIGHAYKEMPDGIGGVMIWPTLQPDEVDQVMSEAAAEIESLRKEVARCHARLEIDHYFVASGEGEFTRVEIPMDERQDWHDGIECRDATISLLEADLVKYRGVKP